MIIRNRVGVEMGFIFVGEYLTVSQLYFFVFLVISLSIVPEHGFFKLNHKYFGYSTWLTPIALG